MTDEDVTMMLAMMLARARFGPGRDMGGRHDPLPTEIIEARRFMEALKEHWGVE